MSEGIQSKTVYLKDYRKPSYEVESYELNFDLYENEAIVTTTANYFKNIDSDETELVLN